MYARLLRDRIRRLMNRTNTPQIKSVTTTKEGRFWALKADGKLLAIVLYKTGAFELKRLNKIRRRLIRRPIPDSHATQCDQALAAVPDSEVRWSPRAFKLRSNGSIDGGIGIV